MKHIAAALLKVQQGLDPVHKGRKGYGYNYADLPAVMNACLEALNAAGVLVIQSPTETNKQAAAIVTRLIHADSGEEIASTIEVPYGEQAKMSAAQVYGSAMTYARRYALVSMLGIVTEDDDGASAGKKPQADPNEVKSIDFARGYKVIRESAPDKAALDKENKAKIDYAARYPEARKLLAEAGVPL